MKNTKIVIILILSVILIGCGSNNNNILGIIELNETTRDDVSDLKLEMDMQEVWNNDKGTYEYIYIWDYGDYKINNVQGTIRISFEDYTHTAKFVNFSAEATKDNMEQLVDYLVDTYGKDYQEVEDYITRWSFDDLIIDYVLTDENTVEIRWYTK